jgi:hypothetical protein
MNFANKISTFRILSVPFFIASLVYYSIDPVTKGSMRLVALVIFLLAVLSDRLDHLIARWKQAEGPLHLDGSSPLLFHRPPEDFAPVVPDAPMGNVLGFQYRHPTDGRGMGVLSFFRWMGLVC